MKKLIQFCLLILFSQAINAQSTHFVKSLAVGLNDGTSWTNAFTSLEAALLAAEPGDQIWVASGSYRSTATYPNNVFELQSGVALYGGFAGTETSLGQRNIALNPTILSGDAMLNDLPGVFTSNRTDNAQHVIHTSNGNPNDRAIIDGFTISGGHTLTGATDPAASRRGAGVHVESKVTISNCVFTDNYGENGVSIMVPSNLGSGLIVENCRFEGNEATQRAAGIYFINLNGASVKNCVFKNNKTQRGAMYPRSSTNVTFDNLLFEGNTNQTVDGFCSGIYNFDASFTITNSQFLGNSAGSATSIYNNLAKNTFINKCLFDGNIATSYGGNGVMSFQSEFSIDSCTFKNASAPSSASAIYNGDTTSFVVSNSLFDGMSANYASAVANYGEGCIGIFDNCTFSGNTATNGGGACSNGFKADVLYKDCTFTANTANFGGAIFTQNDTTRLRIEGGIFSDNSAVTNGGVVYKNPNIHASIKNTTFTANSADTGGAIYAVGDSALVVENTIFTDHLCFTQGGAVNVSNNTSSFTNCLFARNLNLSAGNAGGAIINNASEGVTSTLTLVNCTVADNVGPLGAGIAQWEDDTSNAVLVLMNCLIQNPDGINYEVEAGAPEVISQGGNQFSDSALSAVLTGTKDLVNAINTFVNPDLGDYHLLSGVAVDGGVTVGAPTSDLEGTLRVGAPDTGCYEWGTNSVFQPAVEVLPLHIAPNPVTTRATITLNNEWAGSATLQVINANGAIVRSIEVEKPAGEWQFNLSVNELPAGAYRLQLLAKDRVFGSTFVK